MRNLFSFPRGAGRIFLIAVALTFSAAAAAQETAAHNPEADFALSPPLTANIQPAPQPAAAPKDFRLVFTMPLLGTNNAVGSSGEIGRPSGSPDVHFNPDLLLRWTHQFERVRVSASANLMFDRYFTLTDQSSNTLTGGLKVALTDGQSDLFVPYAAYSATADYEPGFKVLDDRFHNFSLGFTTGIGLSSKGSVVPFRDTTGVGDWSFAFDVSAGQRLAAPSDFQNTFATIMNDIVYNVSPKFRLGFLSMVRFRDYANYFGMGRHDTFIALQTRAELTPEWLTKLMPGAEIDFAIEFRRNMSTVQTLSYSRWEAGPALILTQRF